MIEMEAVATLHTHLFAPDEIGQPPEEELTEDSSHGCRHLHSQVLVGVEDLVFAIDIAKHGSSNVNLHQQSGPLCSLCMAGTHCEDVIAA